MKKIILLILFILVIFGVVMFTGTGTDDSKTVSKNKENKIFSYKDVTYENVIFSDIRYTFKDNTFIFTSNISSLNEDVIAVKSINIILKKDNVELGRLIGYVGGTLEYNDSKKIIAEGNINYTSLDEIEFEFNN